MAKKKAEGELTQSERIDLLTSDVNAYLNAGRPKKEWQPFVARAEETWSPFKLRRPTGIVSLDLATGGGLPAGGTTQIAALDGVGKNALCHQIVAQCQRIYGEESAIAWVCTEFPLDKPFAHMFGVVVPMSDDDIAMENLARKRVELKPLTKSQVAKRQRSLGSFVVVEQGTTAQRLEAVVRLVKSNLFQIIVLDSIGAVLTETRDEKDVGEETQQMAEARLVTQFQQKLWGAYSPDRTGEPNWTTLLVINQARAKKTTSTFGRKWGIGGAHALRHGKLGDIVLIRGEYIEAKKAISYDEDGTPLKKKMIRIGKEVKWEIAKGKAGFHDGPSGTIDYHYDSGFQVEKDLVDAAFLHGVIIKSGKSKNSTKYALVDENGDVMEEYVGKASVYEQAYDELWFRTVYELVLRKEGVTCIYKL